MNARPLSPEISEASFPDQIREAPRERPSIAEQPGALAIALFLTGVAIFLYLVIFAWPAVPVVRLGASGINLINAARMTGDEAMYRDFFQYTPPGTEVLYAALIKVFGQRNWIPNAVMLATGVGYAWLGTLISAKVLRGWSVLLPSAIFMAFGFTSSLYPTHHMFSIALILGALAVLIEGRSPGRLVAAGALCGLATCFTQTRVVPLIGIALYLIWEGRRDAIGTRAILRNGLRLLAPAIAVILIGNGFFAVQTGIGKYLGYTVAFPLFYYRADPGYNSWAGIMSLGFGDTSRWYQIPRILIWAFITFVISAIYFLFLPLYKRQRWTGRKTQRELVLIDVVGLSLVLTVWYAPHFRSLSQLSLPGFVLFVWYLRGRSLVAIAARRLLWAGSIAGLVGTAIITQTNARTLTLPTGSIAFTDPDRYELFRWVAGYVRPGQYFFDAHRDCYLYYYLGVKDPCVLGWVTPNDYTRPEQVSETRACLAAHHVSPVLWAQELEGSSPPVPGDNLEPLRQYLRSNYHVASRKAIGDESYSLLEPNQP